MSVVLYRKHRPQFFKDVVGQEHIVQTLVNALAMNQVGHAYLFCGHRGTGKTTLARLLAKAVNCKNRKAGESEPCGTCVSCTEIAGGRALDLIEIDAASNRGIDEMRALKDGIRFAPTNSPYKIFVIDECHMLTKEAFNALLKTLEEPPSHAMFILATTEAHKVPATIISRCQRFDFRLMKAQELVQLLKGVAKKEKHALSDEVLQLAVAAAQGSARDAESILGSVFMLGENPDIEEVRKLLGLPQTEKISTLVDFVLAKKNDEALQYIATLADEGTDFEQYGKMLMEYMRALLVTKINPALEEGVVPFFSDMQKKALQAQREQGTAEQFHHILERLMEAQNEIRYASIPQLPLELAVVEVLEQANP